MAAAITGGDVFLDGARPDLLQEALQTLRSTGVEIEERPTGIRVARNGGGLSAVSVETQPFPGFPTDLQAQLIALMCGLRGAQVMATDLRASVSLIIAGLAAQGETVIDRVYHLDRGFERIEDKLGQCGAQIERLSS
jgi:UDP-N-acetylglucosamine 1-carboxyvinyltransferase